MKQVSWNVFDVEDTDPPELWDRNPYYKSCIFPSDAFRAWKDEQGLFIDIVIGVDSFTLIFLDEEAIMLFKLTWFEGSSVHVRL